MMDLFDFGTQVLFFDAISAATGFAVNSFLQSTLLIGVGLSIGWLLKSRGSAAQSVVYRTTLVAVLCCPLVTLSLSAAGFSGWSLKMPVAWTMSSIPQTNGRSSLQSSPNTIEIADSSSTRTSEVISLGNEVDSRLLPGDPAYDSNLQLDNPHFADANNLASGQGELPNVDANESALSLPVAIDPVDAIAIQWFGIFSLCAMGIWLVVALLLCTRLATAWWKLWRLRRDAVLVEPELNDACELLAARMNVSAPEVFRSPFLPSPCLAGIRKPAILLPETGFQLSRQNDLPITDVLIHELAHLRRHDCHWNLLRRIATSVFFFQPLLWLLSRRVEVAAEEVCDDYVVQFGGDRVEYAHCLVDIAELSSVPMAVAGVGVVSLHSMLKHRVTRILDTSRTLSTRVNNLILVTVLGCGLMGTTVTGLLGVGTSVVADNTPAAASENSNDKSTNTGIVVHGRVVDGNDRPIAGATVNVVRSRAIPYQIELVEHRQLGTVQTNELGAFEFEVPPAERLPSLSQGDWGQWQSPDFIVTASGFASNWNNANELDGTVTIRLSSPVSLRGRFVNADGTPAVGVEVRVKNMTNNVPDEVKNWMVSKELTTPPKNPYSINARQLMYQHPKFPGAITTDDSGHFEIAGLADSHNLKIEVSGKGVMQESLNVFNQPMRPFTVHGYPFYGSGFEHTVTPGVAIEGTVACAETGEALVGCRIAPSITEASGNARANHPTRATTDANGHFRMEGLPPNRKCYLKILPPENQPYVEVEDLALPESDAPVIKMDVKLRRGVFVSGRVTDSATGKAVAAYINYFPFKDNENAKNYQRYSPDFSRMYPPGSGTATNKNGEFQIVAIPGRGIITANADDPQVWRTGFGAEKITGFTQSQYSSFNTYNHCSPSSFNSLAEVNINTGLAEYSQDLQIDRGTTVRLQPIDQNGKPLRTVEVLNSASIIHGTKFIQSSDTIEIVALSPEEERPIILFQREQGLGSFVTVQAPKHIATEPTVHQVELKPFGIVKGRLIDEAGTPVKGMRLIAFGGATSLWRQQIESIETAEDGSFQFNQLVPNGDYQISRIGFDIYSLELANVVQLEAGATVDLGTIDVSSKVQPEPNVSRLENVKAKATSDNMISGTVVGADGKRVPGAELFWMSYRPYELESLSPKLVATSDHQGEFTFENPPLGLAPDAPASWDYMQFMVVKAPGYGFSIERPDDLLRQARKNQTRVGGVADAVMGVKGAIISLPPAGNPLRGRVVDIDGKGVADAKVRIRWFDEPMKNRPRGVPKDLSNSTPEQWTKYINSLINIIEPPQAIEAFPMATTDADGRFELKDVGADRLFQLMIEGERIELSRIIARNQPGDKVTAKSDYYRPDDSYDVHPQEILHIAGPSNPIEGRIVDYDTGEPIAGALVRASRVHGDKHVSNEGNEFSAYTDLDGNYRITGLPLGRDNVLICMCRKSKTAYPVLGFRADSSTTRDVLKHELRMKRGVWAEGRVFDADTDKPMTGAIDYRYFQNAELEAKYPGLRHAHVQWAYWTNRDGYFRLPVWPTRGILAYHHDPVSHEEAMQRPIDRYPRAAGADSIPGMEERMRAFPTFPTYLMAENYQRLIEINPSAEQHSVVADMPMVTSKTLFAKPVWPSGVSIKEYQAYGSAENWGWENIDSPEFEIKGLKANEVRKIFVFHRDSNLIGTVNISSNTRYDKALEITVQPAGKIEGRLLDSDGLPVTDATLYWGYGSGNDLNAGVWAPHPGKIRNPSQIPTDQDGRFQLTGIVPGLKYTASATAPRKIYSEKITSTHIGTAFRNVTVETGETKNLGDLRLVSDEIVEPKPEIRKMILP